MGGFLDGKAAVITGSTSGIGLGYARALAAEGCDILLNGFGDANEIESARAAVELDFGVTATYHGADMRQADEIKKMIDTANSAFGKIDILINNAGMQYRAPVEEFPLKVWNEMFAVNVTSAMLAIQHVLPQMKARNWGRIINTASVNSQVTSPNTSGYTASKHAIMGLTKATALETIMTGVTCNAICPGTVQTPSLDDRIGAFDDPVAARKAFITRQPMGRLGTVEEIAALAVYLASDESAYTTGTEAIIDGGMTI